MKNLLNIANECMAELDEINIPYGEIEDFVINTRAKSRWGQCKKCLTENLLSAFPIGCCKTIHPLMD